MKKVCAFYTSDYHFEMISLPYIDKKLENEDEIIILTQNNLENTIKVLLERLNLRKERKEKILKLNWKDNDLSKFKQLKENINEEKNINIFIKGNKNYINNVNKNISNWVINNSKINIIDCYDLEEVNSNMDEVISHYKRVLRIDGEKEISEI